MRSDSYHPRTPNRQAHSPGSPTTGRRQARDRRRRLGSRLGETLGRHQPGPQSLLRQPPNAAWEVRPASPCRVPTGRPPGKPLRPRHLRRRTVLSLQFSQRLDGTGRPGQLPSRHRAVGQHNPFHQVHLNHRRPLKSPECPAPITRWAFLFVTRWSRPSPTYPFHPVHP